MNDFVQDDKFQRRLRDGLLGPYFYKKYACDGRYVFVDKGRLAGILQQRYAVDTILQGRDGSALCIEEKIVRWKGRRYDSFFLETRSCTLDGLESPGWMEYGQADYLNYCFQAEDGGLNCWLIDFPKLQAWFWPLIHSFRSYQMAERNRSEGRLVLIEDVRANVPAWNIAVPAAGYDDDGHLYHRCALCGDDAPFGYGVKVTAGALGRWYCREHRPDA